MVWKRINKINWGGVGLLEETPQAPKKEFVNMMDILVEAERYDSNGEKELSLKHLEILKNYIIEFEQS